jgi:hypothetical protein
MIRVLDWFNWATTAFFTVLLTPFRSLSPVWPLTFVSLLTALLMLWVYRRASDQEAIGAVRQRLRGHLLALRLFRHDSLVILRVQGSVLRDTGTYLRLSLVPLLVMTIPLLIVLSQMSLRFSARPLAAGESTIVTVRMAIPSQSGQLPTLSTSAGVVVETPAVRVPARQEASWRVRAVERGDAWISVQYEGHEIRKHVSVGGPWRAASRLRSAGVGDVLLNPGEAPLASSSVIRSIEVAYPDLAIHVFGWETGWLTLYLLETLAFSFLLKRPLGVEF